MPCFTAAPSPDSPEHEAWLVEVRAMFDSFAHVVDYYYSKAGLPMPQPRTVEHHREWFGGAGIPPDAADPPDPNGNKHVLRQILLHLDCDGVGVFKLNEIGNYLASEPSAKGLGYAFVLVNCFAAMRNHAVS